MSTTNLLTDPKYTFKGALTALLEHVNQMFGTPKIIAGKTSDGSSVVRGLHFYRNRITTAKEENVRDGWLDVYNTHRENILRGYDDTDWLENPDSRKAVIVKIPNYKSKENPFLHLTQAYAAAEQIKAWAEENKLDNDERLCYPSIFMLRVYRIFCNVCPEKDRAAMTDCMKLIESDLAAPGSRVPTDILNGKAAGVGMASALSGLPGIDDLVNRLQNLATSQNINPDNPMELLNALLNAPEMDTTINWLLDFISSFLSPDLRDILKRELANKETLSKMREFMTNGSMTDKIMGIMKGSASPEDAQKKIAEMVQNPETLQEVLAKSNMTEAEKAQAIELTKTPAMAELMGKLSCLLYNNANGGAAGGNPLAGMANLFSSMAGASTPAATPAATEPSSTTSVVEEAVAEIA